MTAVTTSLPIVAAPPRAALPALVAGVVYAVLLLAGDQLLRDPDTYWQITIGNGIVDRLAVPHADIYSWTMRGAPWISTQWLAQVLLALAYRAMGWGGPVILAAFSVASAFGLLTRYVARWLPTIPTLVLASAAFALTVPHLVARPHVLAMPVMVAFVSGLVSALDRRAAPSWWLLPLMTLWANLHGGFVFGLALIAPIGLGAIWAAPSSSRRMMLARWCLFGVLALGAACVTPYGWNSMLASQRILGLGKALALIGEWRAADFGNAGPLEFVVLGGIGLALCCGFTLSPVRAVLVMGLVFMALSHVRNAEVLALLGPLVLASPLAERTGRAAIAPAAIPRLTAIALALIFFAGTTSVVAKRRYAPDVSASPVEAVRVIRERGLTRVLNDYDFGGYLISAGVPTYIDGRTELYGEASMVAHDSFSGVKNPDDFFALIADQRVEATLLRTQSAATKLLDRLDGWKRIYADDLAVVHLRDSSAKAAAQPHLRSSLD